MSRYRESYITHLQVYRSTGRSDLGAFVYLLEDLVEGLVVGRDDGAVVVLEVLVDDAPASPDAWPLHADNLRRTILKTIK